MKLKYIYLLIFGIGFSQLVHSQSFSFTVDTAYLTEMSGLVQKSNKPEVTEMYTRFSPLWNSGQLTTHQKAAIIEVSNNLLKKRARIFPHFYNYMRFLVSILGSQQQSAQFNTWHRVFEIYSANKEVNTGVIDKLFESFILLNDSGSFYESKAVLWKYTNNNYRLQLDVNDEPKIHFNSTDLVCFSKRDSTIIKNTSGYYYPMQDLWRGQGGTVTWERAGFSKDSVYAKLNNYKINLKLPEYKADTVEFINRKYLSGPLTGSFEEKIIANARGEKASFPRFESYDKRVDLKQVVPGIDYSGGFLMQGSKFIGLGDFENNAELFIYKDRELFAKASSTAFIFDKDNIQGNNVGVYVKLEEDTLWHPGLNFNYIIKNQKVALNRSGGGLYRSKFYNSYHKLEVDINEISFNLNDTVILFKSPPATTYRKAIFESQNYFSENDYDQIKLMDFKNPLEQVRGVAPSVGEEFEVRHLAHYIEKPESACINLLLRLSDLGFVHFDIERKTAYPKQKLFDYIKSNYKNKDYDAIRIISEPPLGNNAVLNLNNYELTIYGVKPFVLSENRKVGVVPANSTIIVKKDLEIEFGGKLQAGLAHIYGKDLTFNYDSFYVDMQHTDSLRLFFRSEEKNQDSVYEYAQVTSTIDSISGLLRIDKPHNKSGVKTYHTYPVFESHQKSYVFYDIKSGTDTVYKKQDFYFENKPFEIDSLNTITRNNVRINGTFRSAGVFPDFEEDLLVQPDSSLGFVHKLAEGGMPLYNGLGTYDNTITLNNSGLKGYGRINYLNTSLYSEQFDFYPDSMNTYTNRVEMAMQNTDSLTTKYPEMHADSTYIHWEPSNNQMFVTSLTEPHKLFDEKAKLSGKLKLSPDDLGGEGTLTFLDANLESKYFVFYDQSFKSDTVDFKLQPEPGKDSPFLTYNVNANVDFDKKLGMFKSNGSNSYIEFPVNEYRCYMNYFSWHMGINQIDIGTLQTLGTDSIAEIASIDSLANNQIAEDAGLYDVALTDTSYTAQEIVARSKFVSTNPLQDSLSFYALSSSYDINKFIIRAKGVKFITVADAHIFPASTLIIEQNARIQPFNNARIVANRSSRFHKFYGATVNVLGARKYYGSGDYEYLDRLDSMQMIHFSDIRTGEDFKTIANGEISDKEYFKLSPEFSYFGKTKIIAEDPLITFDGYTMINHLCEERMQSYWLQFEAPINPDSIVIPITDQPRDNEFRKLQSSVFVSDDSLGVYTSFLTTKKRFSDNPVLPAKGCLYYNDTTGYYEICDSARLANPELDGNYLSFHKKLCLVLGRGKMDLGVNLGQVKLTPTGKLSQNLDSYKTQMSVMLGIDFFFNEAALTAMANELNMAYSLSPVDLVSRDYQLAFKELVGYNRAKTFTNDFALIGGFSDVPAEMNKTLFLSQVNLKWDNYYRAWVSVGKIGIGNLKNHQVSKYVDGFIEVKKSRGGDILNIYLEIDPKKWFYFTYTRGTLKTISSSDDYNNYVINLKDKDRKSPVKDEDTPYMFFPATDRAKDNFVDEMKKRLKEGEKEQVINLDEKYTGNKRNNNEEAEQETTVEEDFLDEDENGQQELLIEELPVEEETKKPKEENINKTEIISEPEEEIINENEIIKEPEEEISNESEIKKEPVQEEVKKTEVPVNEKKTTEEIKKEENKVTDPTNKKEEKEVTDPNAKKEEDKRVIKKEEEPVPEYEEEEEGEG